MFSKPLLWIIGIAGKKGFCKFLQGFRVGPLTSKSQVCFPYQFSKEKLLRPGCAIRALRREKFWATPKWMAGNLSDEKKPLIIQARKQGWTSHSYPYACDKPSSCKEKTDYHCANKINRPGDILLLSKIIFQNRAGTCSLFLEEIWTALTPESFPRASLSKTRIWQGPS